MVVARSSGLRRLFLAVPLSDEARTILSQHLPSLPGKVVPPENWHLTVRFLGRVDEMKAELMTATIDQVNLPNAFEIRLQEMGAFPRPGRATVLWLGISRGLDQLQTLNELCEEAAQSIGLAAEDRPYAPHLTLARIRPQEDVRPLLERFRPIPLTWTAAELVLFESALGRGGAVYRAVERFPLMTPNGSG